MAQYRTPFARKEEWVLGIGFALWTAASPAERVALLAHEIAHKVNDDPMRQNVHARAKLVLNKWYETFATEGDHGFIGHLVQFLGRSLVGTLLTILSRLSHFESQRAEYRADAHAARVSGPDAAVSLLKLITRADLARRSIVDLYPYTRDQNGRIFDHMGAALASAEPQIVDRFLAEAAAEKRCVDGSHPPTTMRIEFLRSLPPDRGDNALDSADVAFADIDAELDPFKHALGRDMMQELHDVEVNR